MAEKLKFFDKLKLIITDPDDFFDKVEKDKSIKDVFEFYFLFVFLSIIVNFFFVLPEFTKSQMTLPFGKYSLFILFSIIFVFLLILLTAASSFVLYWFCHIIIKLFRGKKGYKETYKLLYAATPMLIVVALVPFYGIFKLIFYPLFILAALDTFYIEYIGLKKLQKMSKENAISVIVISALIGVLTIVFFVRWGLIVL